MEKSFFRQILTSLKTPKYRNIKKLNKDEILVLKGNQINFCNF